MTAWALTPAQSTTGSVSDDLMQSEVTGLSAQSGPELGSKFFFQRHLIIQLQQRGYFEVKG